MNGKGILRFICFSVVLIILASFSVSSSFAVFTQNSTRYDQPQLIVDGADVSPVADLAETGAREAASFATSAAYCVFLFVLSTILSLILAFAGVKKDSVISETELKLSAFLTGGAVVLSFVILLFKTHLTLVTGFFLFTLMWLLPVTVIYFLRLWSKKG